MTEILLSSRNFVSQCGFWARDNPACANHGGGASRYPDKLDAYMKKQKRTGPILGPFCLPTFSCKVVLSPRTTAKIKDSGGDGPQFPSG